MPIAKTRLSDQVAQELQNMIADETYKVGQKLPVENELAQMFSVSRVTVREAVRKLSVMGILDVRQGGGTFVKCLTPESFMTPVLPMLALDKKNLNDIFEVRILIECKSAELAAQNITDAQLEKLKRLLDKMDACALQEDLDTYNQYDTKFHYLISASCGNKVLKTIQGLVGDMVSDAIRASLIAPNALTRSCIYHKKIYDALCAHDPVAAQEYIRTHLEGGAIYIKENA